MERGVDGRSGHEAWTHKVGVRLRESLPLSTTSHIELERLPHPARPPAAHGERSSIVPSILCILLFLARVGHKNASLIKWVTRSSSWGRQAGKALGLTLQAQAKH